MNRDTFPGMNLYACVSRLADDIADRIALAGHPVEIDEIVKEVWGHHFAGTLTEEEAETLHEAAQARREALQEQRPETRPKPRTGPSSAPWASARRPQRSPDRQASIERRRRLVASGPLPPPLAARFTWGEIAVMRIVGDECRAHGCCFLHIDAIAARAGVHRTTVQNALREAQGRGCPVPPSFRCRNAAARDSAASPTSSASWLASGRTGSARAHADPPPEWVQITLQPKN